MTWVPTYVHPAAPGTSECSVPNFPGGATFQPATGGSSRGLVVMWHGLDLLDNVLPPTPANSVIGEEVALIAALNADGWTVVYPNEVGDTFNIAGQSTSLYNDIRDDAGHGSRYRDRVLRHWDLIVNRAQQVFGDPLVPIIPVGGSMGGFYTLAIAIGRPHTIAGYVAHHPATNFSRINPSQVTPDFTTLSSTAGINIGPNDLNGVTNVPGLLAWGTGDVTIDYPNSGDTLTPAIYAAALAAGCPVSPSCNATGTSSGGTPELHVLVTADVTQIMAWFAAVPDLTYSRKYAGL